MKDFSQYFLKDNNEDQYKDPFLYLTKEVEEEILELQGAAITGLSICNFLGIMVTAPLQTIATSLQLSVKPHKTIYYEPASKSKELAKLNTSLTLQEKRKLQLILRSGGEHKPFTAPVYEGYFAAIKGLANQGYKAFFKGLFFRGLNQLGHFYAFSEIGLLDKNDKGVRQNLNIIGRFIKIYVLQTFFDIGLNFLGIMENRYILQNNITQFKVFRNATRVFQKIFERKEPLIGMNYHFINNFFFIFFQMPLYVTVCSESFQQTTGIYYYLSELLMYPLNTAYRRLVCQHTQIAGMIPIRYSSLSHAVKLIYNEEGILGLYKGYGLYHLIMLAKLGIFMNFKKINQTAYSFKQYY